MTLPPNSVSPAFRSCDVCELQGKPFVLVGHRTEIAQPGMKARLAAMPTSNNISDRIHMECVPALTGQARIDAIR